MSTILDPAHKIDRISLHRVVNIFNKSINLACSGSENIEEIKFEFDKIKI